MTGMNTPTEALSALHRLREGNQRFICNQSRGWEMPDQKRRDEMVARQEPFAIILGCSDSRAPAELVFDQGLGDLFVIRVAGNIVAPSQIGSVEFAASRFGTRLVVVMGHSQCGAILATLDEIRQQSTQTSRNLRFIVDRVRPSLEPLAITPSTEVTEELVHRSVRAHVRASADQLRSGSDVLKQLIQDEGLVVVGAEYSLETGVVDFFEGIPQSVDLPGDAIHSGKGNRSV